MAVNVAVDSLCNAIVAKLSTELVPATGGVTAAKPAYLAQRYTGSEFKVDEAFRRGIAGRTPALLVHHAGDKSVTTTMGRRVDRVESTISVVVCTDAQTEKERRSAIIDLSESVRSLIGARAFSLPIQPMRWTATKTVHDSDLLLAIGVTFTTKHRVDYTVDPGEDTMDTAAGTISAGDILLQPTVTAEGTEGVVTWVYRIDGIDDEGARYEGIVGRTEVGAATLSVTNFNRITWTADDRFASYEVVRVECGTSPATTGTIGATSDVTFDDTGIAASSALLPEPYTQEIEVDLT